MQATTLALSRGLKTLCGAERMGPLVRHMSSYDGLLEASFMFTFQLMVLMCRPSYNSCK